MKKDTSFHDYIVYDLMNRLFDISSRPMMSGWCIYSDKVPFASIIGNQLYLKAKGEMAEKLASLGWTKFNYEKSNGKSVSMNYWLVPDELIDDVEAFEEIAKEILMSEF
jgi:TfoX/Sxy family transcriptional regulator of competence genes